MSAPTHPEEALQDYLDGRLTVAAAEDVRAHLETCAGCRTVRDELMMARDAASALRDADVAMPADLLASLQRRLDAESAGTAVATRAAGTAGAVADLPVEPTTMAGPTVMAMPSEETLARWAATRRRRWLAVASAAALVTYLVLSDGTEPLDLPAQAARDLGDVGSLTLPFAVAAADASELERYFAASAGPRVRVIDLAMMNIVLEGGVRHTLDGRPSALYSYRTPSGARLVCQMYEGRLAALPPPVEVREQNGFRFQVYTRGAVTLVFWQEGELVCVLASELPANEVLALAVAKAMTPAI